MIPLRDVSRQPLRFPIITVLIIAANALVFVLELIAGAPLIDRWSLVPADILAGRHLETILTAMFLHAGWLHILSNMLFLWVFGPEIEDAMGPDRYAAFYLLGGLVASAAQIGADPGSTIPILGASGAIAAVMGAFLITYPGDRIRTLVFIGVFVTIAYIPAIVLIGLWFLSQLFDEIGALASVQTGGIAYLAHIGGAIFGLIAVRFFRAPRL